MDTSFRQTEPDRLKIGYQGDLGSNSEEAAERFVSLKGLARDRVELIPLITSAGVSDALAAGKIDLGVMALQNSLAGPVRETEEAVAGKNFRILERTDIPIHHCVFIRREMAPEEIRYIASHIQALSQTAETRRKLMPAWQEEETIDTAQAARDLRDGKLPADHAVICRKNAGLQYGLKLVHENIEDRADDHTTFGLFRAE